MTSENNFSLNCPLPIADYPNVLMAHGSGGRMSQQLISNIFYAAFSNPELLKSHDSAVLTVPPGRLAMTTDSYVIRPLFFPGGDIGSLAVNGTLNDLAMSGARPLYLSAAFILEEGLPIESLWRIAQSMRRAADAQGVAIVTGDTKVVERGHGDGVYINTSGIGVLEHDLIIAPQSVREGDAVLVSGDIGRHGMAVMSLRDGLSFESPLESDCMALVQPVLALLSESLRVHCLRDVTRGGLAAVLNEITASSGLAIAGDEMNIPVSGEVRAVCEILGLDPLHVACEGRFVAFVDSADADKALAIVNRFSPGGNAARIGTVIKGQAGLVTLATPIGGKRIIDMPSGELLPRIC